ncbi:hypothetical protein [Clostridium paraputrificum]|uniref:Uncharacterized protein n=1 Tax=Clostridium paraputrificum TaxID=29363 RepID=A0A6N3F223_9CLOT
MNTENNLKCNVCGKEADAVTSSILGGYSEATCPECRKHNRVNYRELVITFSCCGIRTLDDVNPAYKEVMKSTLEFFNKTEEELFKDIEEENRKELEYERSITYDDFD